MVGGEEVEENPRILHIVAIFLGYASQLGGKILLQKILHTLHTEHTNISLKLWWKLLLCLLSFIVTEGVMQTVEKGH